MTLPHANWNYPTLIRFGAGRIAELPQACRELGLARPLLVTDPGLAALPMIGEALERNAESGIPAGLFCKIRPNPTGADLDRGVAAFAAGGHDGIIAFGGGAALDVGKTIAFMSGQSRPLWDFEDIADWWSRADPAGIAPVIAVPTTAGTGSEVGRAGVLLDEDAGVKKIIFHPKMMPRIVISDPELSVGLPPHITAATGMDALSHCLEAWCAPGFHPMADGIAAEGTRLIHLWLRRAVDDGTDLDARGNMLIAASMGATAFQKGLGGMHALSHPIGALFDTHHGLTNAVLMPYVLDFNRPAIEERLTRLAAYIGLSDPSFDSFRDWILALRRDLAIPHALTGLGVTGDRLDQLSEMAEADPSAGGNPLPFPPPQRVRCSRRRCADERHRSAGGPLEQHGRKAAIVSLGKRRITELCRNAQRSLIAAVGKADGAPGAHLSLHPALGGCGRFGRVAPAPSPAGDRPGRLGIGVEGRPKAAPEVAEADLADEAGARFLLNGKQAMTHRRPVPEMAQQPVPGLGFAHRPALREEEIGRITEQLGKGRQVVQAEGAQDQAIGFQAQHPGFGTRRRA
jgi:alcohol dehydrogenase class IV